MIKLEPLVFFNYWISRLYLNIILKCKFFIVVINRELFRLLREIREKITRDKNKDFSVIIEIKAAFIIIITATIICINSLYC